MCGAGAGLHEHTQLQWRHVLCHCQCLGVKARLTVFPILLCPWFFTALGGANFAGSGHFQSLQGRVAQVWPAVRRVAACSSSVVFPSWPS
jgi:hypothetical protein